MYGRDFRYAEQCLDWIFLLLLNKYGHLVSVDTNLWFDSWQLHTTTVMTKLTLTAVEKIEEDF